MKLQETDSCKLPEATLEAVELQPVIAPGISPNHNEVFVVSEAGLQTEELEPVIAPGIGLQNHNETFLVTA